MTSRRKNGGGWGAGPDSVSPGYLVTHQYDGPGKDCAGAPMRPGYMDMYSKEGLPGFQGGKRSGKQRSKRMQGGRYEVIPGAYLPANAIGASSPGFVASLPCEASRTPVPPMQGGKRRKMQGGLQGAPFESSGSSMNFPQVHVGAADSMRYEAPNAGYANDFTTFRTGAVPGFTVQTPYNASSMNQACLKTGGSHQMHGVAENAAPVTPLQLSQVGNRSDFDNTKGGLPVKFGGSRKHRKHSRKHYKHQKHHHSKRCKHQKHRKTKKRRTTRKQ
jgi:hypothetical protein